GEHQGKQDGQHASPSLNAAPSSSQNKSTRELVLVTIGWEAHMPNRVEPLLRHLRKAFHADEGDAELLSRFIAALDEAAFESLVRRHGRMVLSLCRRVLGNVHDAEDAFQATFLVLTQRPGSVSRRESLGNWLYGVAYRTALHARRRRPKERQMQQMTQ